VRPTETDGSSTCGTLVDYTSWMDVGTRILLCRSPLLLASIGYDIDSCYILGSVSLLFLLFLIFGNHIGSHVFAGELIYKN